ncbi:hypothetical protein STEG23_000377, partial [Scotinomys teguina]
LTFEPVFIINIHKCKFIFSWDRFDPKSIKKSSPHSPILSSLLIHSASVFLEKIAYLQEEPSKGFPLSSKGEASLMMIGQDQYVLVYEVEPPLVPRINFDVYLTSTMSQGPETYKTHRHSTLESYIINLVLMVHVVYFERSQNLTTEKKSSSDIIFLIFSQTLRVQLSESNIT